ncbi:hypothetical protein VH567_07865 [Sphingomonas sp. 4RDLI-65]|uniref:hypothetical protein n=1 Tax=Sphingomonas sp. 4RDLI-65 TaxID=3111641 RepID=UPI003C1C9CA9
MTIRTNIPRYGNVFFVGDNFDELRNVPTLKILNGYSATLHGRTAVGDGRGGTFAWNASSVAQDDDDKTIAPLDGASGRWIRIDAGQIGPKGEAGEGLGSVMAPGGSALVGYKIRSVAAKLNEAPLSPEDFGALGDGIHDDAPAIQAALNAITATAKAGTLIFSPGRRYRCDSQIVLDRAFHNISGAAVLDFSHWNGVYIKVDGSYTEFGNGYGMNGSIDGQIVINGSGKDKTNVGVLFETALAASSTHIRTVGMTITNCAVAWQFGSRGYNQEFINCKAMACGVIFDWLTDKEDNDERVSIFGGTFYNSDLFIRHKRPAGGIYVYSSSIDYVAKLMEVVAGKVQWFGVHTESNRFNDCPIEVSGDGGLFVMVGGWFLMQSNTGSLKNFVKVGAGSSVKFDNVITNNTNAILTTDALTPTTWATGAGRFEMRATEPGFAFGGFPARLHDSYSALADGSFDAAVLGQDTIWRDADTNAIQDRYGAVLPSGAGAPNNLVLTRTTTNSYNGSGALRADKQYGATSAASFVLMAVPVRYGDKIVAGFRMRSSADRPGTGNAVIQAGFAKLDGYDQYNVPKIARFDPPGELQQAPTQTYQLILAVNGTTQIVAPSWSTHFIVRVNLVLVNQGALLFDGLWCDRM